MPANTNARLTKDPGYLSDVMEVTPLVYRGHLTLLECRRPTEGGTSDQFHLQLRDVESNAVLAQFGEGHGLGSAIIHDDEFFVFASRWEDGTWNDVTLFRSRDLKRWRSEVVIRQAPGEHLFNTSACAADGRFVMAYETDDPQYVPFSIKFAESPDLAQWTPIPGIVFAPKRYAACPCLRYADGYFQMLYLEHKTPEWRFETYLARSRDLRRWRLAPGNPILAPTDASDGINASDPDIVEFEGKVTLYYAVGDQRTWAKLRRAVFEGSLGEFYRWAWRKPAPRFAPPQDIWKQTVVEAAYPTDLPLLTAAQERFKDLKFGIFVHWGLYAVLGHGEWALFTEHIPIDEYDSLIESFGAEAFDADVWADLAQRAGARYLNFVTKHHDGFCLFDSKLTDHTSVKEGPRRDFAGELAQACEARKLPLFFYYSLLDWHFPDFTPHSPEYRRYYHGQVEELLTRYGPVAGLWFDMGALIGRYHGEEGTWDMIRERQPEALIMAYDFFESERSLTGTGTYDPQGHLLTFPAPPPAPDSWPLEVCDSMNASWGYNPEDTNYRTAEDLIRELVAVVGKGGNLLLNVSPKPDGSIPPEQVERLDAIGDFLHRNGQAIYDTRPAALPPQPWGCAVTRGSSLYLHILQPSGAEVLVEGLHAPVAEVRDLQGRKAPWRQDDSGLTLCLPAAWHDPADTVVEVVLS